MHRQGEQSNIWRLIDTGPLSGAENMAVDEALLRHFDPAGSRPVLRLYGWEPPALSIGRFQPIADINLERCQQDGISCVRRITGGGTIFHADELTYSVVCRPDQIPAASSVKDSFRVLTAFLLAFYRSLGLSACYAVDAPQPHERLGERTAFCFAGRESYDILVNGRKIGGNAQRRQRELIFQHGSIPLRDRTGEGLGYLCNPPASLDGQTTCLEQEGVTEGPEFLKKRLLRCFQECMGCGLVEDQLAPDEAETAERFKHDKYGARRWNREGEES